MYTYSFVWRALESDNWKDYDHKSPTYKSAGLNFWLLWAEINDLQSPRSYLYPNLPIHVEIPWAIIQVHTSRLLCKDLKKESACRFSTWQGGLITLTWPYTPNRKSFCSCDVCRERETMETPLGWFFTCVLQGTLHNKIASTSSTPWDLSLLKGS